MNTPSTATAVDGAFDAVDYAEARDLPVATARTEYSAAEALAYVDDTESLRNPVERALAAEVHRLRGTVAPAAMSAARAAVDLTARWRAVSGDTGAAQLARYRVQAGMGAEFITALDALAEVV